MMLNLILNTKLGRWLMLVVVATATSIATSTLTYAQSKPELVVYTYDSFSAEWGAGPLIKAGFEAECDCTLNFVGLDTSLGVLGRVRLEGASSKADVVLGLDTAQAGTARATGLFTDHGLGDVNDRLTLPEATGVWQDEVFVPFDWGYFAFVYDKDRLRNPPQSMAELVDGDHPLTIAIQDARTSTPGFGLLLWLKAIYGDEMASALTKLDEKITTITKGWSEAYGLFLDGEVDMVLSYTTSPSYHRLAEDEQNYDYASFSEGHYMQIEIAGILKSSTQPILAREFLAYLLSPEAQAMLPQSQWMYPVGDVVLPQGFQTKPQPKPLLLADEEVADKQKQWLDEWVAGLTAN